MADAELNNILARATRRSKENNFPYRGALTPVEAYYVLEKGEAQLIDVRSRFEWEYVGRVPNSKLIEWKNITNGELNGNFLDELAKVGNLQDHYFFLCRSGARSHAAAQAAAQHGYSNAFNILEGFEGDLDADQHRNCIGGWRAAGLPWVQS